jgi:hypothetical protein
LGYTADVAGAPNVSKDELTVTEYLKNTSSLDIGVSSYVLPSYIIVPINTKQHLPYSTVREFVEQLYKWYGQWAPGTYGKAPVPPLSWSIRLIDQVAFKGRMLKDAAWLSNPQKEALLRASLPRLLWTVEITSHVDGVEAQVASTVCAKRGVTHLPRFCQPPTDSAIATSLHIAEANEVGP